MRRNLPIEERKERILAVSLNLFLSQGYSSTTVDDIVSAAGGSKSAIYQIFEGKEGILAMLIDRECDQFVRHTIHEADAGEPLAKYLDSVGRKYLHAALSQHTLSLLRECVSAHADAPNLSRAYLDRGLEQLVIKLAANLQIYRKPLHWARTETIRMAEEFFAMCRGRVHLQMLLGSTPQNLEAEIEERVRFAITAFSKMYCDSDRQDSSRQHEKFAQ